MTNLCQSCRLVPAVPGIRWCCECAEDVHAEIAAANGRVPTQPGTARIDLINGGSTLIDLADFNFASQYRWRKTSTKTRNAHYAADSTHGRYLHRLLLGAGPDREVDHVNGDGLDNRRCNLRMCSRSENAVNKGLRANNASGYTGVYWNKSLSKWVAQIGLKRKATYIGIFAKKEDAIAARIKAEQEHFGEFAPSSSRAEELGSYTGETCTWCGALLTSEDSHSSSPNSCAKCRRQADRDEVQHLPHSLEEWLKESDAREICGGLAV